MVFLDLDRFKNITFVRADRGHVDDPARGAQKILFSVVSCSWRVRADRGANRLNTPRLSVR